MSEIMWLRKLIADPKMKDCYKQESIQWRNRQQRVGDHPDCNRQEKNPRRKAQGKESGNTFRDDVTNQRLFQPHVWVLSGGGLLYICSKLSPLAAEKVRVDLCAGSVVVMLGSELVAGSNLVLLIVDVTKSCMLVTGSHYRCCELVQR